jgi:hypothetical protein
MTTETVGVPDSVPTPSILWETAPKVDPNSQNLYVRMCSRKPYPDYFPRFFVCNFAKHDVLVIQPVRDRNRDEKLRPVGVAARVSHGQQVRLRVGQLEILADTRRKGQETETRFSTILPPTSSANLGP